MCLCQQTVASCLCLVHTCHCKILHETLLEDTFSSHHISGNKHDKKDREQPTAAAPTLVIQVTNQNSRWRAWCHGQTAEELLHPYLRKIWSSCKIQWVQKSGETGLVNIFYLQIQLDTQWRAHSLCSLTWRKCACTMTVMSLQRGVVGSNLFCVTVILFAQGFEKLQIHLWLRRPGFHFALVATRCSCGSALNFAESWFWERQKNIQGVRKTLRQKQDIPSRHGTSEAEICFAQQENVT